MKKNVILLGLLSIISASTGFAEDHNIPEQIPESAVTRSTFYGTEASNKSNNPCRGATTRVCGIIETQIVGTTNGSVVTKQVYDYNKILKDRFSYFVATSPYLQLQIEIEALPSNAVIEIEP